MSEAIRELAQGMETATQNAKDKIELFSLEEVAKWKEQLQKFNSQKFSIVGVLH